MPYDNVPKSKWDKMDRCVADVQKDQNVSKSRAIAICHKQVVGKDFKEMSLAEKQELVTYVLNQSLDDETRWSIYQTLVFDSYVVVKFHGLWWMLYYTLENGIVTFDVERGWIHVEHEFSPVTRRLVREPFMSTKASDLEWQCYGVLFGDSDNLDLYKTYFNADTEFRLSWFKERPWLHQHGFNKHIGLREVGIWKDVEIDEVGVFLKGELDAREKYLDALQTMLASKEYYPSSGSVSHLVIIEKDGWVRRWPIIEVSSTVAPAEYRIQPMSASVRLAMRTLEGEGEDGGVFHMTVDTGKKPPDPTDVDKTPAEEATTEVVEPIVEGEDVVEELEPDTDVESEVEAEVEGEAEAETTDEVPTAELAKAVVLIDGALKSVTERLDDLAAKVDALGTTKAEAVKEAIQTGSLLDSLFVATRDGKPIPEDEAKDMTKGAPGATEGASIMGAMHPSS